MASNEPSGAEEPGEEADDGHRQMVELLADLAERAKERDPFVGLGKLPELTRQLEALTADAAPQKRWRLLMQVAKEELRLGESEAAAEHYAAALKLGRGQLPGNLLYENMFQLGIAFMRWGETQNCVARHTSASCIFPIEGSGVHVDQAGSRKAIARFERLLSRFPDKRTPRWLLNIAYMTVGEYPDGVPEPYRIPAKAFRSDETFPRFVDRAPDLGLNAMNLAGGSIVDDFDGDGWLDIVASTMDSSGPMRFFRGQPDGSFREASDEAGLAGLTGGLNMLSADYDDDGLLDIFVLRGGWRRELGDVPNSLLRNRGDGTFVDVTFEAGLGEVHYPTQTAAWADYDNDGDLDLYVGNETDSQITAPCQLFRNEGDGTFLDVAKTAGVTNDRYTKGVVWGDYDGDRLPDLYVSNMRGANRLYRNGGDGTFTDVAEAAGVSEPLDSFPVWFWDFDNNGVLDLWVSSYVMSTGDVAASALGQGEGLEVARLYRGDGKRFEDVARAQGLTRRTVPMGCNFGDLDNDGYLDFYQGTGYPSYEALMPNVMYRNRGGTGFSDVTTAGGFGHLQKGHAVSFADIDYDGDQDVHIAMGGAYPGDAFGNALFENPGFPNNWIKVRLVGRTSNSYGVGARIRCEVGEGEERRSIYRHVNTGGSFGANPLTQSIGLGRATEIDVLEIYWPTSDLTQIFENVDVNQSIRVTEGEAELERLAR